MMTTLCALSALIGVVLQLTEGRGGGGNNKEEYTARLFGNADLSLIRAEGREKGGGRITAKSLLISIGTITTSVSS